jgi:hypothetical protein
MTATADGLKWSDVDPHHIYMEDKDHRTGIFDLNRVDDKDRYNSLMSGTRITGEKVSVPKVEILLHEHRWQADGRLFIAVTWYQPKGFGEKYVPSPVDLVRNQVAQHQHG